MANLQKQLIQFHEAIKLNNLDENATLREKRDILLDKLRANLEKDFQARGQRAPSFQARNQGSYAMGTGVKPVADDYDIDVALLFNLRASEHQPVAVREWVAQALRGHKVEMRRSCVTVWYQRQGEPVYHVDFAVYSAGEHNPDGQTRLAKGYPGSAADKRLWEPSDPMGLCDKVKGRFQGEDQKQMARAIRALKRWADVRFSPRGQGAPVGIGLTCAAYHGFQPVRSWGAAAEYDDLEALRRLVDWMLGRFQLTWTGQGYAERLSVQVPVVPHDDPFRRMSDVQMGKFKEKLRELRDAIGEAQRRPDVASAVAALQPQLGDALRV